MHFLEGCVTILSGSCFILVREKSMEVGFDYLCKFVIFGDSEVGKTTLEAHLDPLLGPRDLSEFTIGVNFQKKTVGIKGHRAKLQIWLMLSEDRFFKSDIFRAQIKGSLGAILLYDITNASSLDRVPTWCEVLEEHCGNIPILLVGNKIDEEKQRAVSKTRAVEVREKYNLASYMEISAKTGANVEKLFDLVAELMIKKFQPNRLNHRIES